MNLLFRWGNSSQYHYVVAKSFGDAEVTIRAEYNFGSHDGDTLECLGCYVQISSSCIAYGSPQTSFRKEFSVDVDGFYSADFSRS